MSNIASFKPEQWQRPWPSPNCAYNINLRAGEAKFNREKIRVEKEAKSLERVYRQNIRKLNAAHRGVISMLGRDPYPNCEPEHVLFEHNQPGFCYRRNGQPRLFCSLLESKTRKIIQDLDGKEGLLHKKASNIISDSPVMAEILSSPDMVEILCDLRTTAVLISDPKLFAQFSSTLMKSPNSPLSPLPFNGQRPMDCLKLYRKNLINEFFDTLRIQIGIRRSSGKPDDPTLNNYLNTCTELGDENAADTDTPVDEVYKRNYHFQLSDKQWNEAVIERLLQATFEAKSNDEPKLDTVKSSLLDTFRHFTVTVNAEDNLKGNPSTSQFSSTTPTGPLPPSNTVTELATLQTATTNLDNASTLEMNKSTTWDHSLLSVRSPKPKRNEFDRFVKNLVTEVEKISEVGKNMVQLQKKKPQQYDAVASPLVRLLRKKSLFSSLNEDDLLFYEYDGGRRDAANSMARGLNINQPRPGGFTFRVPSRSEIPGVATGAEIDDISYKRPGTGASTKMDLVASRSGSRPSGLGGVRVIDGKSSTSKATTSRSRSRSRSLNLSKHNISITDSTGGSRSNSVSHQCTCSQRSLKRLCCPACNAKLRTRCNEAQERDRKDTEASDPTWKMPGMSNLWTKNSHKDSRPHHLLSSIPLTLKKNYATHKSAATTNVENGSEYGTPIGYDYEGSASTTNQGRSGWRGVPTPVRRRKNLLPEISRLMSTFVAGSRSSTNISHQPPRPPALNSGGGGGGGYNSNFSNLNTNINSFANSKFQPSGSSWGVDDKTKTKMSSPILKNSSKSKYFGRPSPSQLRNGTDSNDNNITAASVIPNNAAEMNSWTLKVNKMDIMKLKHELEVETVRQKMIHFENDFLNTTDEIMNH